MVATPSIKVTGKTMDHLFLSKRESRHSAKKIGKTTDILSYRVNVRLRT